VRIEWGGLIELRQRAKKPFPNRKGGLSIMRLGGGGGGTTNPQSCCGRGGDNTAITKKMGAGPRKCSERSTELGRGLVPAD